MQTIDDKTLREKKEIQNELRARARHIDVQDPTTWSNLSALHGKCAAAMCTDIHRHI